MNYHPSTRAEIVTRRTYNRQKEDGSFETIDYLNQINTINDK